MKVYNDNPPYIRTYICGSFSTLRASQIFLRVPNAGVAGHVSLPAAIGATDDPTYTRKCEAIKSGATQNMSMVSMVTLLEN